MVILLCIIAIAVFHAAFGQGTGPVLLRDVRCIGNEYSLLSCSHSEIVNYCSHYNDAGVLCTPCKLYFAVYLLELPLHSDHECYHALSWTAVLPLIMMSMYS